MTTWIVPALSLFLLTLFACDIGSGEQYLSKVYVANSESHTISVIDAETNKIVKTIRTAKKPVDLAISPDSLVVAVANEDAQNVQLIDARTDEIIQTIQMPLGTRPLKVALASRNKLLLLVNDLPARPRQRSPEDKYQKIYGNQLISIDAGNPTQIDTVLAKFGILSEVRELAVAAQNDLVFLAGRIHSFANFVSRDPVTLLNYRTKQILSRAVNDSEGAVFSRDGRFIYVHTYRNGVCKFDTEKLEYTVLKNLKRVKYLTIHPAGNPLYATSDRHNKLSIVDLNSMKQEDYELSYPGNITAVLPARNRLYLLHSRAKRITVFDLNAKKNIADIAVGEIPADLIAIENHD